MPDNACLHYQGILKSLSFSPTAPMPHFNIPGTFHERLITDNRKDSMSTVYRIELENR